MKKQTKIVLAESESIIAEDVANLVKTWGFDLLGRATTQDELMKFVKDYRPEVIIFDTLLRGKRDTSLIAQQIYKKYGTSLVILGDRTDLQDGKSLNRKFSWVAKPFKEDELKKAVKKMASKRAA
ncbi:hypothetical protein J7K93_03210 [bacterium]|nr:hypothetical protein [bacterium]